MQYKDCDMIYASVLQIDGTIIAPTSSKAWSSGPFQWLEFTKLVGITIKGSGTIDGSGSVWWKDAPFGDPIDDEYKLIVPLNRTMPSIPQIPVIIAPSSEFLVHVQLSIPASSVLTFCLLFGGRSVDQLVEECQALSQR